jgi:3-dehydroquinate synthase
MHNLLNIPSKVNNYTLGFVDSVSEIEDLIDQSNTITIIDHNVSELYPNLNRDNNIVLVCNENSKTLEGTALLISNLINLKVNIKTKLVVIGGGILQDLVGFSASIYARGIEYILVPTTLLAQTDSCVGGKTSINFDSRKNLIGTFYPPISIVICTKFLDTLSPLDYISGLGEIYKFHILQNKTPYFSPNSNIESMILDSLKYKVDILSRDEFDKGERKFLNFGHTFGHALESTSNHEIPHGVAVILGSMLAVKLSNNLGYKVDNYDCIIEKGIDLIQKTNINFDSKWFDFDSLMEIVKSDKKSTGKLTMVLIDDKPFLENVENVSILKETLKQIYESI